METDQFLNPATGEILYDLRNSFPYYRCLGIVEVDQVAEQVSSEQLGGVFEQLAFNAVPEIGEEAHVKCSALDLLRFECSLWGVHFDLRMNDRLGGRPYTLFLLQVHLSGKRDGFQIDSTLHMHNR